MQEETPVFVLTSLVGLYLVRLPWPQVRVAWSLFAIFRASIKLVMSCRVSYVSLSAALERIFSWMLVSNSPLNQLVREDLLCVVGGRFAAHALHCEVAAG